MEDARGVRELGERTVRIAPIIAEFLDYRSYVSHTLCKHRLMLGMDDAESAGRRLRDASVWPLVHEECRRLLDHSRTLFGLRGVVLDEMEPQIRGVGDRVAQHVEAFLGGGQTEFKTLHTAAREYNNLLSLLGVRLEKQSPSFDGEAVKRFLGTEKHWPDWMGQARGIVRQDLAPLVTQMLVNPEDAGSAYQAFWPHTSGALFLSRISRVAGAAEDVPKEDLKPIAVFRQGLRDLERMVSCWSPVLDAEARQRELQMAMRAQGFRTIADIQHIVRRLEVES